MKLKRYIDYFTTYRGNLWQKYSICTALAQILSHPKFSYKKWKEKDKNRNKEELMNKCTIEIVNLINSKNVLGNIPIFYNCTKINTEKDFIKTLKDKIITILNTIFLNPENYFCKVYDTRGEYSTILREDTFQELIDKIFYDYIIVDKGISKDGNVYSSKEQFLLIIANEIRNAFSSTLLKYNYFKEMFNEATDWDTYYRESNEYWQTRSLMFKELKL